MKKNSPGIFLKSHLITPSLHLRLSTLPMLHPLYSGASPSPLEWIGWLFFFNSFLGILSPVSGYDGHRRCACSVLRHNMPPLLLPSPVQVKAVELNGMFIYLLCYEICRFIICLYMRSYPATHARVSFPPLGSRHLPSPFALHCDATVVTLTRLVTC